MADDFDQCALRLIELCYGAAMEDVSWSEFGLELGRSLQADSTALWQKFQRCSGGVDEMLASPNFSARDVEAYVSHFHTLDPWERGARSWSDVAVPGSRPSAFVTRELVDLDQFRRSEFYVDFARGAGMHHIVGTVMPLGEAGLLVIGCHRPETAEDFTEEDRRRLELILPHLRRALQLRYRLRHSALHNAAAALDALQTGAVVVDMELHILHANAAAEAMATRGCFGFRRSGTHTLLATHHHADTDRLGSLVRSVATGDGGALTLRGPDGARAHALVTRLPQRWDAAGRAAGPWCS